MSASDIAAGLNASPLSNPFEALAGQLKSSFYPKTDEGFLVALRVTQSLFAATLFLAVVTLALSIQQRQFWLFRCRETAAGRLVLLNMPTAFLLIAGVVASVDCIAIEELCIKAYFKGSSTVSTFESVAVPLWSLFLGTLLCQTYSAAASTFLRYSNRLDAARIRAWHLHSLFALLVLADIGLMVAYAVAAMNLHHADVALLDLCHQLSARAPSWTYGQQFAWQDGWIDLLDRYTSSSAKYFRVNRGSYVALASLCLLVLVIFVPTVMLELNMLFSHQRMGQKAVDALVQTSQTVTEQIQDRQALLRKTVAILSGQALWLLLITFAFTGYSLALASRFIYILGTTRGLEIAFSIGFALFNLASLPVVLLLLVNQIASIRRARMQRRKQFSGIKVARSVTAVVDTATRIVEIDLTDAYQFAEVAATREVARRPRVEQLAFASIQLVDLPEDKSASHSIA